MISRVLIIKLSSLGDILHFLWLVPTLKKHYPQLKISWAVSSIYVELLKLFPEVDEVIGLKDITSLGHAVRGVFSLPQYIKALSKYDYDVVIDGQGLLRSGVSTRIVKAKMKIGFAPPEGREGCHWFYTNKVKAEKHLNIVDKYTALLEPLGIKELVADLPEVKFPTHNNKSDNKTNTFFETYFKKKDSPRILLNPSTSFHTKDLPKHVIRELADEINKKYQVPIIILSNPGTSKVLCSLKNENENQKNILFSPELNLSELLHFTNQCDVVIGTDSGPTYMAEILGKPSIILFGPTNAERQSPSSSKSTSFNILFASAKNKNGGVKQNVGLYSSYQCPIIKPGLITAPYRCIKRNCKDNICMQQFRAGDVLNQLEYVL